MGKQCAKSDFHNNRLGLWLQMGRVKRVSWRHIVRGPARRGAPLGAYKGFGGAKTLAQGGIYFRCASKMKGLPFCSAKWENNVQNPTFITTVWGYGYKWDA